MSPGVIAFEALLFRNPQYTDSLSPSEEFLFDELADAIGQDVRPLIDEMILEHYEEARQYLIDRAQDEEGWENVRETPKHPPNVHLPKSLAEELPYKYAKVITDAVIYVQAAPWSSRTERLTDLQDLLKHTRGESVTDPSEWVQAVIDGDSDRWDVSRLHDLVSPDLDWWERDDVEPYDLVQRGETIPQTKSARLGAVRSAWRDPDDIHDDAKHLFEEGVETMNRFFSDYSESTHRDYAKQLAEEGYIHPPKSQREEEKSEAQKAADAGLI